MHTPYRAGCNARNAANTAVNSRKVEPNLL